MERLGPLPRLVRDGYDCHLISMLPLCSSFSVNSPRCLNSISRFLGLSHSFSLITSSVWSSPLSTLRRPPPPPRPSSRKPLRPVLHGLQLLVLVEQAPDVGVGQPRGLPKSAVR